MDSTITYRQSFNYLVLGISIHSLANFIGNIFNNLIILGILGLLGWYYIILAIRALSKKGLRMPFRGIYGLLFKIYIGLLALMILRGYLINYNYQWVSIQGIINHHFLMPYYILPYFLPLIIFIPIKTYDFVLFTKVSFCFCVISIIIYIVNIKQIIFSSHQASVGFTEGNYGYGESFASLYIGIGLNVLLKKYIPIKYWVINFCCFILTILVLLISARRGSVFMLILVLLSISFLHIKTLTLEKKILSLIAIVLLFFTVSYYLKSFTLFSFIIERGLDDNRTNVDESMLSQMSLLEQMFGMGLNGRYYLPLLEDDYLNGWRYGTETGFYNLVLKGGYVLAIFHIIILIIPAIKGILFSKNDFSKALGFYIFLSLVELYPFGWLTFNLKYFVIWIGIVLCNSKAVRQMNDFQIKKQFFNLSYASSLDNKYSFSRNK